MRNINVYFSIFYLAFNVGLWASHPFLDQEKSSDKKSSPKTFLNTKAEKSSFNAEKYPYSHSVINDNHPHKKPKAKIYIKRASQTAPVATPFLVDPSQEAQSSLPKLQQNSQSYHPVNSINESFESIISSHKSVIHLKKESIEQLILKTENIIQLILHYKRREPLDVKVDLEGDDLFNFPMAFSQLVQKYPYPFIWNLRNEKPYLKMTLYSAENIREEAKKKFIYQCSADVRKQVNWELIYDLVTRSDFNVKDFKYNNSLKIRTLALQQENKEKNVEEIIDFIKHKASKDINPFYILGVKINKTSGLEAGQFLMFFLESTRNYPLALRGSIYDQENNFSASRAFIPRL